MSTSTGSRGRRGGRGDLTRRAAFDVLKAVRVDDAYANLVLPHVLDRHGLGGRDAAFTTELAAGTLRGQGTYDAVLAACVDRPLSKVQAKVLDALRLGAHQLLAMRVPDHAAIATTVDLVRSTTGPGAASFANAVLRRVAAQPLTGWVEQLAPPVDRDPLGHAVVAHSHPRWVVEALAEAVGEEELPGLLSADNDPPRVTLVARPGRITRATLLAEAAGEPTVYSPYGVVLESGTPAGVPAVLGGDAGVQDEGSQLVALALADGTLDGRDERWLDLCAGPGGKAALLAALAGPAGAAVIANERQQHRAGLVRGHLTDASGRPVPGASGVVAGDGTRPPYPPASMDRVLVDAPCSGLGALRRRPEARWRRRPEDLGALVPLQRALLSSAIELVRPGGIVLYATCSPVLTETRSVVESVLAEHPEVALEPVGGRAGAVPDSAGPLPGTVQLWPHRHGTDAMFLALLRRCSP